MSETSELYASVADLPDSLPIFPLPGALLLPGGDLPLHIFEPRYLTMVSRSLGSDRLIGMIQPRQVEFEFELSIRKNEPAELYDIGCAGRITSFVENDDGHMQIVLTGVCRFRLRAELEGSQPFRTVEPTWDEFAIDLTNEDVDIGDARDQLLDSLRHFLKARSIEADWDEINDASTPKLINTMTMIGSFSTSEKQALLEAPDLLHRARTLAALTDMSVGTVSGHGAKVLQ